MTTSIAYYRALARKHPPLPQCAEVALMRRIAAAETQKARAPAVDELVRHNLGRVVALVGRLYEHRPSLIDDAASVAVGALFSVAQKADDARCPVFWAYAEKRVRGELIEFDRRQPLIPVSRYGLERTRGMHAHRAAQSDYSAATILTAGRVHSLDAPVLEDDASLHDVLPAEGPTPADSADRAFLAEHLEKLAPRTARVLTLAFGLAGDPPMSQTQIGNLLEISSERVRQIRERGLEELREAMV